jgi:hypothetical protein
MNNLRIVLLLGLSIVLGVSAVAKDKEIAMMWPPNAANPSMSLVFSRFQQLAYYNGQNSLSTEVTVRNLSDKPIARASLTVYFYDKQKVRIGETSLLIQDLKVGQQVRYPLQFFCVGIPASLELQARNDANGIPRSTKNVPIKIITVPPGATLQVDGQASDGLTPKTVYLSVGTHNLQVSKEGYAVGNTPVEVTADELPGGSITIELGGLSQDTIELRDGSILLGDVISMSLTEVDMRVNGEAKKLLRNNVKKMILVERDVTVQQIQLPAQPSK